jgi:hypothetical protein
VVKGEQGDKHRSQCGLIHDLLHGGVQVFGALEEQRGKYPRERLDGHPIESHVLADSIQMFQKVKEDHLMHTGDGPKQGLDTQEPFIGHRDAVGVYKGNVQGVGTQGNGELVEVAFKKRGDVVDVPGGGEPLAGARGVCTASLVQVLCVQVPFYGLAT